MATMYGNIENLDKEIARLTETLGTIDPLDEKYEKVRDDLKTLYQLRNDQYKVDTEDCERRDKIEAEMKQKQRELEIRERELEAEAERQKVEAQQKAEELAVRKQELALTEKKLEAEKQHKAEENDTRLYEIQVSEKTAADDLATQKKNRIQNYVTTGLNAAVGIVKLAATIGLTIMLADQGYKFEENGCPTSRTFKDGMKNAMDMVRDQFKSK